MYLVTVSKNCSIREAAQIKLLSLKDSFSVESFFSLRIKIIRHIDLRYHHIQYSGMMIFIESIKDVCMALSKALLGDLIMLRCLIMGSQ